MAKHRELSLSNAETRSSLSTAQHAGPLFGSTDSPERDFKLCQEWLDLVSYKDWHLELNRTPDPAGHYVGMLTIKLMVIDTYHPNSPCRIPVEARHLVPRWILDHKEPQRHFYDFVHRCIQEVEMHELDEWLRVGGRLVKNPHDPNDKKVWEPGNELPRSQWPGLAPQPMEEKP